MECIYVIGGNEAPYKIGFTTNLHDRLKDIQTGHPHPLKPVAIAETPNAAAYERQVHLLLSDYRLSGEWFHCGLGIILSALTDAGLLPTLNIEQKACGWMSAEAFQKWQEEIAKPPFYARTDAKCAELLGISANSVVAMKKNGADLRTALACRALLHRMEPYS